MPEHNQSVTFKISVAHIYYFFIFFGTMGLLMLWFENDIVGAGGMGKVDLTIFFQIYLCLILLALSAVPNFFIPVHLTIPLRTFAAMLVFSYVDRAVCATHSLMEITDAMVEFKRAQIARVGAVFLMVGVCVHFVLGFLVPRRSIAETWPKAKTIRGISTFIACFPLLVGQILTWTIWKNCDLPVQYPLISADYYFIRNASPILLILILVSSTVYDDRHGQDLGFFLFLQYIFSTPPIFGSEGVNIFPDRLNYDGVWRAEIACYYAGALIFALGVVIDSWYRNQAFSHTWMTTFPKLIRTKTFLLQMVLLVFGIGGAISVYAKSGDELPSNILARAANYGASFAIVIPVLLVWGDLSELEIPYLLALLFSMRAGGAAALSLSMGLTNYTHNGFIVLLLVSIFACALRFFRQLPQCYITDLFSTEAAGVASQAVGKMNPAYLSLMLSLAAALAWSKSTPTQGFPGAYDTLFLWPQLLMFGLCYLSAAIAEHKDTNRMMYFWFLSVLTDPIIWPTQSTTTPADDIPSMMVLLLATWYVVQYSMQFPSAVFETLHADGEQNLTAVLRRKTIEPQEASPNPKDHQEEPGPHSSTSATGGLATKSAATTNYGTAEGGGNALAEPLMPRNEESTGASKEKPEEM